jgi:hypothetical protein
MTKVAVRLVFNGDNAQDWRTKGVLLVRISIAAAREIREAIEGKTPLHVELSGEINLTDFVKKLTEKAAA